LAWPVFARYRATSAASSTTASAVILRRAPQKRVEVVPHNRVEKTQDHIGTRFPPARMPPRPAPMPRGRGMVSRSCRAR
jgi:hypothetical protein